MQYSQIDNITELNHLVYVGLKVVSHKFDIQEYNKMEQRHKGFLLAWDRSNK